jgi:hypothetical protein
MYTRSHQLIYAIKCVRTNEFMESRVQIVAYLANETASNIDLSSLGNEVMVYAQEGNTDMLELLYTIGVNMTNVDCGGRNILHIALANEHINVLRWAGSKRDLRVLIEKKDKFKRSPLDEAVAMEDGEAFETVLRDALLALSPVKKQTSKMITVMPSNHGDV